MRLGHRCVRVDQDGSGVTIHFDDAPPQRGKVAVGCDGIHSALRRQLYPDEGPPKYSGVNMWRGAMRWPAYLGGDTMVSTGWMTVGKTVIYPVRAGTPETGGMPLINWVAEIERPEAVRQDWTGRGRLCRHHAGLRRPEVRLARHQRHDREHRGDPRIPDGRPRPAAALDASAG